MVQRTTNESKRKCVCGVWVGSVGYGACKGKVGRGNGVQCVKTVRQCGESVRGGGVTIESINVSGRCR